jgi:ribonuclease VapC
LNDGIVVDSSALLAILFAEPEGDAFTRAILSAQERHVSAFSLLEAGTVALLRKGHKGRATFDALCEELSLELAALSRNQVKLAREAYERFGKGRHPAALNLGDCCSYALAKVTGLPLLCKGNDFSKTDLPLVSTRA